MKIALFSDVHANLPALESFFESIEAQKPDAIYCLGDLVGYNIWSNEVINAIRKKGIPTIAGNHDEMIGQLTDQQAYKIFDFNNIGEISLGFTNNKVEDQERAYLKTLPRHIRLEFQFNSEKINILFVHGSPRKINEYLYENHNENDFIKLFQEFHTDVLCFGHTHKPYHKVLKEQDNGGRFLYKHAINVGSVGKPKDGNPQGCYVLLHIDENTVNLDKNSIKVEFIRFDYDVEKAAKAIENSPLPNEFAQMLRNGG